MPYQGESVSILEMLEVLRSNGRAESEAGIELERAFEDSAIKLLAPAGTEGDAALWRELSGFELAAVISLLRDMVERRPISTMGTINLPVTLFRSVRSIRRQFEAVCELIAASTQHGEAVLPMDRKDAVRLCIEQGMIPASTSTWNAFCERVRDLAGAWTDKKAGTWMRGFDEKTIKRDVAAIMN